MRSDDERRARMDEIYRLVGGTYEASLVPSNEVPEEVQSHFPDKELGYTVEQLIAKLGGRSGEAKAPDGSPCRIEINPDAPEDARFLIHYSFIPSDPVRFTELAKVAFGPDFDGSD